MKWAMYVVLGLAFARSALAQSSPIGAPGGQSATAAAEGVKVESVWDLVIKGGPVMIPIAICSLIALTVIVEERSHKRYTEHAASALCDERTRRILETITRDEKWHINWMEEWLLKLVKQAPAGGADPREILARYREAEEEVFEEMKEEERSWLGFSLSDAPLLEQTQIA